MNHLTSDIQKTIQTKNPWLENALKVLYDQVKEVLFAESHPLHSKRDRWWSYDEDEDE